MDNDCYYQLGSYDKLFNQIDELTDALASRDAEIANLAALGSIYLNRANAAELELDQLHKNVTLLWDELNTIYKLVPDLVELMKPSALAAIERHASS